ncbi:cytochrome c [Lentibacter algarum]|uniref:cytochrome c n=1 Tax=Lentibacter algarum TaxID=576131 RepID=UPI001C067C3B|nr:cytochrome c [Lentibacter algarum]MBU2981234.1 cytochrome c [Lentibacter algarum]
MKNIIVTLAVGAALATAAIAHEDVKNPTVKARMELMGKVKDATGVLGGMAKGEMAFDEAKATAAKAALVEHAAAIPAAFKANETDPKSTAKAEIWLNWADFTEKAAALGTAAEAMDTSAQEQLGAGMGGVGGSCAGCHKVYRIKK